MRDFFSRFLFSFKNLKGADGASLVGVTQTKQSNSDGGDNVIEFTLTDGSKSRVIIRNGSKGEKGDRPDGRMPLNPAAIYDFADAVTRWKKEPIFSQSNIKSKPDHPRVLEPFTLENNKIFKITANITWTGDAQPRLIVTRNDWQKIVLDTTFSGVGSWRVIIPETDTYFVGIWMHGGGSFIPKPDDSVTVKSLVIHQLEQETVADASGNGCVGFVRGHIGYDSAVGKTFTPVEKGCFYFEAYREHSTLWLGIGRAWTHSRWIKIAKTQTQTGAAVLWHYGDGDYGEMTFGASDILTIATRKDDANGIQYRRSDQLRDDTWHHLVVMTNLQTHSVSKTVYLDNQKVFSETKTGFFADWSIGQGGHINVPNPHDSDGYNFNMFNITGSLANLLIFDRELNESEISWLYHNPAYLNKRYANNIGDGT